MELNTCLNNLRTWVQLVHKSADQIQPVASLSLSIYTNPISNQTQPVYLYPSIQTKSEVKPIQFISIHLYKPNQ